MPPKKGSKKKGKGPASDEENMDELMQNLVSWPDRVKNLCRRYMQVPELVTLAIALDDNELKAKIIREARTALLIKKAQDNKPQMETIAGFQFARAAAEGGGLTVGKVVWNGPADLSGLLQGDVIERVCGQVCGPSQIRKRLKMFRPGDHVNLGVRRKINGKMDTLLLVLELGAVDFTMEEVANINRISEGVVTDYELQVINPFFDIGPMMWGSMRDQYVQPEPEPEPPKPAEEPVAGKTGRGKTPTKKKKGGEEEPPPRPPSPKPFRDPKGVRSVRLARKTYITPGEVPVAYIYQSIRESLNREYGAIAAEDVNAKARAEQKEAAQSALEAFTEATMTQNAAMEGARKEALEAGLDEAAVEAAVAKAKDAICVPAKMDIIEDPPEPIQPGFEFI